MDSGNRIAGRWLARRSQRSARIEILVRYSADKFSSGIMLEVPSAAYRLAPSTDGHPQPDAVRVHCGNRASPSVYSRRRHLSGEPFSTVEFADCLYRLGVISTAHGGFAS